MRRAFILMLALVLLAPAPPADARERFSVFRCNIRDEDGTFRPGLRIRFGREVVQHRIADNVGLDRSIVFNARKAVDWTRARYPERTAGKRAYYDGNCGRPRDRDDD